MPELDIQHPEMPDLQFVLFVSALCTSDLENINVPPKRTGSNKVLDDQRGSPIMG